MIWFKRCAAALVLVAAAGAQDRPLLSNKESLALFERTVQLMESTSAVTPELARAGAPVAENARQAFFTLRTTPNHAGLTYTFLTNARAFLAVSDVVAKPFPFPEQASKQFVELRNAVLRTEAHFNALLEQKELQVRNPDRDNLKRYAEANQKLPPPQAGRPRVVLLGDSITDGWRLNEYFPERDFVNRGISGQITGEMLGRMKADVVDLKPVAVLILAGTNDIARGVPLRAIENNLTMIAELAEAHRIKPMFASVLPVSDYHKATDAAYEMTKRRPPATILALNAWLADFCRQHSYPYVDYFSQMVDKAGFLRAELADDGLHPNSAGYRVMAPIALAAIDKYAVQAPEKPKKRFGLFSRGAEATAKPAAPSK